ncbi:MAG: hypothetical protein JWO24_2938 [Rhodospirillales bacterium]|nr:hypothetical protein [Rhodospirillales bacterium]
MNRSTIIETSRDADGATVFKLGETVVLKGWLDTGNLTLFPDDVTKALRVAYKKGRDDSTAQTRAVLRGVIGL